MNIVLISDNPKKISVFDYIKKQIDLKIIPTKGYRGVIQNTKTPSFFYFDFSSFSPRQKTLLLKFTAQMETHQYGIIDPGGEILDIGALFHNSASDYLGKQLCKTPIPPERIKDALYFYSYSDEEESDHGLEDCTWDSIHEGREYPFVFLFIEVDIPPQWKIKSDKSIIQGLMKSFYGHVTRVFSPKGGRLWIKSDFGGLFLFPRNKSNSAIIEQCVRLIINRVLISTEIYNFGSLLTYRICVDRGETEYRQAGKTGTIISDSINYIFHLGQRFTPKGNLIITEDIINLVPHGLQDCFKEEAEFQGKRVYRLLQPVH